MNTCVYKYLCVYTHIHIHIYIHIHLLLHIHMYIHVNASAPTFRQLLGRPRRETHHPRDQLRQVTSYTLHPAPKTFTLHPTPSRDTFYMSSTLLSNFPSILFPTPYTLHPTPYTLHPTPYTLIPPTPYTIWFEPSRDISIKRSTSPSNSPIFYTLNQHFHHTLWTLLTL